jgi:hypothetical protein
MTPWFVRRAKTIWLAGFVVVLAGLAAVLFFVCQSLLPAVRVAHLLPQLPTGWIEHAAARGPFYRYTWLLAGLNAELAFAVLAFLAMMAGAAIARRQMTVLQAASNEIEDRRRRVHQYMSDGRIEPYIGRLIPITDDYEPK